MDIDFHFSTIYILSRWAGFDEYEAKVIATASQFVDDNTPELVPDDGCRISGHKPWSNATDWEDNNAVWIPFHFLPGLKGKTFSERMTCKKNSVLARALAERMLFLDIRSNVGLLLLGISLHVYADTWAHREFNGFVDDGNIVSNPKVLFPETEVEEFLKAAVLTHLVPLGHAQAVHWPDRPYVKWQCEPAFPYGRENWTEFAEAAQAIYRVLFKLRMGRTEELPNEQERLLVDSFRAIDDPVCEERNQVWLSKIQHGDFGFSNETQVEYTTGFILSDEDYQHQFYEALDAHFDWVKERLEAENISIE